MRIFRQKHTLWLFSMLLVLVIVWRFWARLPDSGGSCEFTRRLDPDQLEYVQHATCRMHCREINQDLVEEVYMNGVVNCAKSDPAGEKSHGNPRWALEQQDGKRGKVRIIIEEEGSKHLVITAIRLGEDDKCDCS